MATSSDVAFEVFVKRAVTTIQKEAWGRNSVELRAACTSFLQTLEQHEAGVPFEGSLSVLVLQPLALACATTSSPKVAELALGCLHKLVSHAWLYGESSLFESLMDDGSDVVTQVIRMVVKCGEMPGESLQLQVVQALLTFTTAEHFVAHGDCLMAAVRTVFNLALGADAEIIKRTAGGALLQILNTVVKRITSNMHHVGDNQADGADNAADNTSGAATAASPQRAGRLPRATAGDAPAANGGHAPPPTMRSIARTTSGELHPQAEAQAHVRSCIAGSTPATGGGDLRAGGEPGELASDARTAQFASMAEQRDLRGLEEAIGASSDNLAADAAAAAAGGGGANDDDGGAADGGGDHPHAEGRPSLDRVGSGGAGGGSGGGMPPRGAAEPGGSGGGGAGTSVARTSDSSGGARAPLGAAQQGGAPFGYPGGQQRRMQSLTSLSVMERDVLHVLTAFCKLASRESGLTDVEAYLHQGKLLALELITKVLHNPQHSWVHVRDEFCRHLRQPLCITLLRNCSTTDAPAFALAIKLLVTVMMKRKLRTMLKAELGAFYPLFVLRPLELGRQDLPTLHTVLVAIRPLCAEPQLLVDLFVNYDCDLQAPCLYERTIASLSRLAHLTDAGLESRPHQMGKVQEQARRIELVRSEALRSALSVVGVLKEWASPIREALEARQAAQAQQALLAAAATAPTDEDDPRTTGPGGYGGAALTREPEVERFEAAHSHKASLARGLMMINVKPIKGIQYLLSRGLIPGDQSPASIAAFLRAHISELSKTALGELFGEHDDFSIAIMHAWVDSAPGSWAGVPIDSALRLLLEQFRLPGEAQKIDRIMEKFAERYVIDNPGRVATADGAYVLAFSIIMLNTDAHNPLAERRLAKSNFVEMNTAQVMLPPTDHTASAAEAAG
ncbi:hypothetical protein FOA52_013349 [Chlamydomonas sp. UWO 241]|nr:hypothetical protein FOA52_013349 [Chlamydomonas sp. UWO 241]